MSRVSWGRRENKYPEFCGKVRKKTSIVAKWGNYEKERFSKIADL